MKDSEKERLMESMEQVIETEGNENLASDPLDLMNTAVKVHTKNADLNEDATLANLSIEHTKMSKFVAESLEIISVLRSYLKVNKTIIRQSNILGNEWGKSITYTNPENNQFEEVKALLLSRPQSIMILSRSIKGAPLKSFLTYNRQPADAQLGLQAKQGAWDKLMGKKPEDDSLEASL